MSQSIVILGRQPALGFAELESLYGSAKLQPVGTQAALLDLPSADVDFRRLGGSTRLCKLLTHLPTTNWQEISNYLAEQLPDHLQYIPEGKIKLGLSVIGNGPNARTINANGLSLKKVIKAAGRSVRVVPNTMPELNTAQVLHNQLTSPTGLELVIIIEKSRTTIAQTVTVQDINAYAARDQKRPKRDARVGMLPPKLAQIIINLAVGRWQRVDGKKLLDPFCGTGVVLQESLLMGIDACGTDLEGRMVEYSEENLNWLVKNPIYNLPSTNYHVEVGDATNYQWQSFDVIACETYLGRPFSAEPKPAVLEEVTRDVDTIHRKFLQNVARQTKPGFRMCIAVPAWKTKNGFKHLKMLDSLGELGYNRLEFVHVETKGLLYHRPEQVVARELVILQRI